MGRFKALVLFCCVLGAGLPISAENAPTVLITGANRGLGLAWAEKYAARGWQVIATARRTDAAADLARLAVETGRVRIEQLDITDVASINALGERLGDLPIDILVNNAGLLGAEDEQRLGTLDPARFDTYMQVNALGALLVTERLLPNIKASNQKKVAGISARAASFAAYPRMHSGLYYYKASKVALNMILRNIAMDTRADGVTVAILSPGVVHTSGPPPDYEAMSPEMRAAMVDIDTSIDGMMAVLDELTLAGSGKWYRYDGTLIDW